MAAVGRTAALGLGEESTWGTAVARTTWRPAISSGLQRRIQRSPVPDLHSSAGNSAMRRRHFDGLEEAGGPNRLVSTYENMGMWLKHALGTLATTGTGPYTHTYTLAEALPTGLTIELVRGTATNSEVFEGCQVASAVWEVSSGGVMFFDPEIIAETAAARGSAGTPSFGSAESPVLHSQAGQFSFNSANYDLVSARLSLDNALVRRNFLGSALTKVPERGDFQTVEITVTVEAQDALYTALLADTTSDAAITFTGLVNNSMAITVHNGWISEASDPITEAGITRQTVTIMGESDGTDEGLEIIVINDIASGIAN